MSNLANIIHRRLLMRSQDRVEMSIFANERKRTL